MSDDDKTASGGGDQPAKPEGGTTKIRLLQEMGGRRYDGREWPPPGEPFDVPDWEADELTRTDEHHSHPVAVRHGAKDPRPPASKVPGLGEPEGTARRAAAKQAAAAAAGDEQAAGEQAGDEQAAGDDSADDSGAEATTARSRSRARPQAAAGRKNGEENP